jgi:peptide deformylase
MIYPIIAYGDPVLRKKAVSIEDGTDVTLLVKDMLATMDGARGMGLAAPQIGASLRLFVVDFMRYIPAIKDRRRCRKALINPVLTVDSSVAPNSYEEGCLSIPNILVNVPRREKISIRYYDAEWRLHEEEWTGLPARIMLHEYDHLEGVLHIDYASILRRGLLKGKLKAISQGKVEAAYKMRFPS